MPTKLSAGRTRSTYEFIKANQATFSVQAMCRPLGVAPSGYYARIRKPDRAQEDARLLRPPPRSPMPRRSAAEELGRILAGLSCRGERI